MLAVEKAATFLANDTASSLSVYNYRFQLIWELGRHDVRDGLCRALNLFMDEADTYLQRLILIASLTSTGYAVALVAAYYSFFRPFLRRIQTESTRAAIMLSFLPPKVIVTRLKHVSKKLRRR